MDNQSLELYQDRFPCTRNSPLNLVFQFKFNCFPAWYRQQQGQKNQKATWYNLKAARFNRCVIKDESTIKMSSSVVVTQNSKKGGGGSGTHDLSESFLRQFFITFYPKSKSVEREPNCSNPTRFALLCNL